MSINSKVQRIFANPKTVSDCLKCPICLEVFSSATRLFCGHTFCEQCLSDSMKRNDKCPECRAKINKQEIGFDLLARKIIWDLKVFCPASECPWKGVNRDLDEHIQNNCLFKDWPSSKQGNKKSGRNDRKALAAILDDDVQQKINENTVKGSLTARVLSKTTSSQDFLSKGTSEPTLPHSDERPKKFARRSKRKQPKKQFAQQSVKNAETGNLNFLQSLFQ